MRAKFKIGFWYATDLRTEELVDTAEGVVIALAIALDRVGGWSTTHPFHITIKEDL